MFPLSGNIYGDNCPHLRVTLTIKKPSILEKDKDDEESIPEELLFACSYFRYFNYSNFYLDHRT